jgi:tellurite resistance protein TerC
VVFAVDSIPAIFGVTRDYFIVFTSNIFAVLGLRALYFLLHDLMGKFEFLHYGLGLVLAFIGAKMLVGHWYEVPVQWSLAIVAALLGGSVLISWLFDPKEAKEAGALDDEPPAAEQPETADAAPTSTTAPPSS